jgi:hypothetical protein
MSTKWEQKFPLANVIALSRDILDHTFALRYWTGTIMPEPTLIQI